MKAHSAGMSLLSTKSFESVMADAGGEHTLRRVLGPWNLIALGIGAIIGVGIFVITGTAAALNAGPAIVLSFILAGVGCVFSGLCYAEFAAMIPVAGSAYTYGYATLGQIFAWIIGWDLILEYAFGAATVASGWSANFSGLLADIGIRIPPQWLDTPGTDLVLYHGHWTPAASLAMSDIAGLPHATSTFNLVAFCAICLVTAVLVLGIEESANLNTVMVALKLATVMVFIGVAAQFLWRHPDVARHNWTPFIPPNTGSYGTFGLSGVARGAAVIFFAYIGFDAVSTAAQEAKNPQRDMPIGILGSLAICTVLYIVVALLLTGLVPYATLNVAAPVAFAIDSTGISWGGTLVRLGTILEASRRPCW